MLNQALQDRKLPELWPDEPRHKKDQEWEARRQVLVQILQDHLYGQAPPAPAAWQSDIIEEDPEAFAGKATWRQVQLNLKLPKGTFSFPVQYFQPNLRRHLTDDHGCPFFIHIAFRPNVPDLYLPAEELIDRGFAFFNFCYEDIIADRRDVSQEGLPAYFNDTSADERSWGKITMWAWAASRVMDYAQQEAKQGALLDLSRAAVLGHSRLGKTALWAGARDTRFKIVISNNSGCAGAALERGGRGERTAQITETFPDWFNRIYPGYAGKANDLPFDQHYLLAAIAPRSVYIASAADDSWADPDSEFLAAYAAGKLYEKLGCPGLITPDAMPTSDCQLGEGKVAYHRRPGTHFLSRTDWQRFMDYIQGLQRHPGRD